MKISLGFSPCPNDTFLFDALVHGRVPSPNLDFEVVLADVEELNERALRGELQVSKLSYAALPAVQDQYALLRSGSALGRGVGPLLVSALAAPPLDDPAALKKLRVAIPGRYTTANFLLSWAFPDIQDKIPMLFSSIEDAVLKGEVDAGLLIHENRFTYASRGLKLWADLGERWEVSRSLPIPLGGIVARRDLGVELIKEIDGLLRSSVEYAFANPDASRDYVQQHAQEMDMEVQKAHINLYVNNYTIDLGPDGIRAVQELVAAGGGNKTKIFV